MSLQVWLPLNGDLHNLGLGNITVTSGTPSFKTNGKIGLCLNLNSAINLNCPSLNGLTTFSIAFWAKVNSDSSLSTNWVDVIGFQDATSSGTTGLLRWETCYASGYETRGISSHDNPTNATSNSFGVILGAEKGKWYHLACIVDLANNVIHEYSNGILVRTMTPNGGYLTGLFWLGQTGVINGELNDVRIYDHALSAKEVEEIAKGLVLHYKLDNNGCGNENILTNSSGYQGTTAWSSLVTIGNENGKPYLIAKRTDTTSSSRTFCTHTAITSLVSSWAPGTKFTISGYYKVPSSETQEVGGNMFIRWALSSSSNNDIDTGFTTNITPNNTWIRFENTYTVPVNYSSSKAANFYLSAFSKGLATVYWKDIKLELGDKATSWCPAKTDALYSLYAANDTTVYDSSGYGNNGTITGSLTTVAPSPRYSVATSFNGTNAAILIPNLTPEAVTISFWMKRNANTGTRQFMYTAWNGITCELTTSGAPTFAVNRSNYPTITGNVITVDSGWVYYCATFDTTNGMRLYLNGVLVASNSNTTAIVYGITTNYIGKFTSNYYNGLLSDFRIYVTALTPEQVKELYNTSMSIDNNGNIHARELVEL